MLHHLLGISAIMTVKISDTSLQCDTLIKENPGKKSGIKKKLEHIIHFSVALTINIKKKKKMEE